MFYIQNMRISPLTLSLSSIYMTNIHIGVNNTYLCFLKGWCAKSKSENINIYYRDGIHPTLSPQIEKEKEKRKISFDNFSLLAFLWVD